MIEDPKGLELYMGYCWPRSGHYRFGAIQCIFHKIGMVEHMGNVIVVVKITRSTFSKKKIFNVGLLVRVN